MPGQDHRLMCTLKQVYVLVWPLVMVSLVLYDNIAHDFHVSLDALF